MLQQCLNVSTVAISFLADICLNFASLFGEYVCIYCLACSLVSTFTNETQVSSPVNNVTEKSILGRPARS
jgi:hypothetical protein